MVLVNLFTPTDHFTKHSDISYGEHTRQNLDLYIPRSLNKNTARNKTLIIFFYGGSWDSGEKSKYKFLASTLSKKGFNVAIPDYRLYPEVIFPAFVYDAAHAVKWLQDNIDAYTQDVEYVYLMGHSAGAQIACLLITDKTYLIEINANRNELTSFIGIAGPYNFLPLKSRKLKSIFPEKTRALSQPINFVDGTQAPMLLLHGQADKTVLKENSISLSNKVKEHNGSVSVHLYDEINHTKILAPFVSGLEDSAPTLTDIVSYIDTTNDEMSVMIKIPKDSDYY